MKKLACIIFVISLISMFLWVDIADQGVMPFIRCYIMAFVSLLIVVVSGIKGGIINK